MSIKRTLFKNKGKLIALFVCLVVFVIYQSTGQSYYDYSQISQKSICDKRENSHEQKYLLLVMVTSAGLGNMLFSVFSLLGMAARLNRTAVFNREDLREQDNLQKLQTSIPGLFGHIPSVILNKSESSLFPIHEACCHHQFSPLMECQKSKYLIVKGSYYQSFKYFQAIEPLVRNYLKPSDGMRKEVEEMVHTKDKEVFKSCVHIRRGDFLTDGCHEGTNETFTLNAIRFLLEKHPGTVYILGNDPEWARVNIVDKLGNQSTNLRISNTLSTQPLLDLYFSQVHCDAFLITAPSSTFGWWLAYLSKNQNTVYYRDIYNTQDKVKHEMVEADFFPSEWTKL